MPSRLLACRRQEFLSKEFCLCCFSDQCSTIIASLISNCFKYYSIVHINRLFGWKVNTNCSSNETFILVKILSRIKKSNNPPMMVFHHLHNRMIEPFTISIVLLRKFLHSTQTFIFSLLLSKQL